MTQTSFPQLNWRTSTTTSDAIGLAAITICGFFIPAGWTGTTATFTVCDTIDGTYVPLCDNTGATISYTVAASTYCRVSVQDFAGIRYLKMVGGSSQAANTVVKLAAREFT